MGYNFALSERKQLSESGSESVLFPGFIDFISIRMIKKPRGLQIPRCPDRNNSDENTPLATAGLIIRTAGEIALFSISRK
jgi:hypothetical protein